MKNFLFQQSSTLAQQLVACGFLQNDITDIPMIAPAPETKGQDWCIALHGLEVLPENLSKLSMVPGELVNLDWDGKSGYLNFNFTPSTYQTAIEKDFEEIEIALTHSLRSPELHKSLGAQRQILTRFRRYDEDLLTRAAEIEQGILAKKSLPEKDSIPGNEVRPSLFPNRNPLPQEPAEKTLLNASLLLRYQLEARDQPWSPTGLSQCLAPFTQALNQCWEQVRLDAGGDPELFLARVYRWKYQIKTIKAILREILP